MARSGPSASQYALSCTPTMQAPARLLSARQSPGQSLCAFSTHGSICVHVAHMNQEVRMWHTKALRPSLEPCRLEGHIPCRDELQRPDSGHWQDPDNKRKKRWKEQKRLRMPGPACASQILQILVPLARADFCLDSNLQPDLHCCLFTCKRDACSSSLWFFLSPFDLNVEIGCCKF
eukprot:535116-Pelagomonas_calceolata.AAC.4